MCKIKVMIAEDHQIFREGLRRVLESAPDIDLVCEVADGIEALERGKELAIDVVITDVNMPGLNGLQLVRELKRVKPGTAFIVLTAYDDEEQMFHALRVGASAYFPKLVDPDWLVEAIREVATGNYVVDKEVLTKSALKTWLLRRFRDIATVDGIPDDTMGPLSPREMEILQHLALGRSNKEIAHELGISRQTVKNHMTTILRKLDVQDRTQAAMFAVRRGWIRVQAGAE